MDEEPDAPSGTDSHVRNKASPPSRRLARGLRLLALAVVAILGLWLLVIMVLSLLLSVAVVADPNDNADVGIALILFPVSLAMLVVGVFALLRLGRSVRTKRGR